MKHNILYAIAAFALLSPAAVQAQRVQPVPDEVNEIRIEGRQSLRIVSGDENRIETNSDKDNIARVRNGRMTISSDADDVVLRLAPGRSMTFRAEDYATIEFSGSFAIRDNLTVETEDYAQVMFVGDTTDTVRAVNIVFRSEDFSRITSDVILKHYNYLLDASDFSRIVLTGMDLMESSEANNWGELILSTHINDKGKVYRGRMTAAGLLLKTDNPKDDDIVSRVEVDATDRAIDLARDMATTLKTTTGKRNRHPWDTELDFAWGWNNWGSQIGSGFNGVDGAAGVNTTFHNIQLAVNVPVINVSGFALKAGLGLEWNRYVFNTPEVLFDPTADPMAFVSGTWGAGVASSYLKTCHVTVPVKLEFGNPDRWHVSLTALPGLNWTGKNSGLRRHYNEVEAVMNEHTDKDRGVNRYLNPYMFDVRVAVQYSCMGVYLQLSTLSAFKNGCQELYPIKFGIIL